MKKTFTMITLLAGAVSGYSQGTITFSDYSPTLAQQIFNVQSTPPTGATATTVTYGGYTEFQYLGSTGAANEYPQGSAVFAAGTALSGTGFAAQLFAAAGPGDAISDLSPQGPTLHFYTTSIVLGFVKGTVTPTIPTDVNGLSTIAIASWDTDNGAYLTLAAAQAAGEPWGFSNTATVTPAPGDDAPINMPLTIEGFSLGTEVPEPNTIALAFTGAILLGSFRRNPARSVR